MDPASLEQQEQEKRPGLGLTDTRAGRARQMCVDTW